jgi:hypothetical protein
MLGGLGLALFEASLTRYRGSSVATLRAAIYLQHARRLIRQQGTADVDLAYGPSMQWWKWAFDGVAGAAVLGVLGFVGRRYFTRNSDAPSQSLTAGDHSRNIQAGGNVTQVEVHENERPPES